MAGIFYGWIGVYYGNLAQMVDTWAYHYESIQEFYLLKSDPAEFFKSLFRNNYDNGYTNFLVTKDSWWNDFKGNFFIKILSIFNLLSLGNYYTNLIFFSFLSMFGPLAIFRVMKEEFPGKKIPVLLATFLVPSFLYWTSGLHKDGLIFTGIALVVYSFYFGLKEKQFKAGRVCTILLGMFMVLALRNFLLLPLLGGLFTWTMAHRLQKHHLRTFFIVYTGFLFVFFTGKYIHPRFDFPKVLAIKQGEFRSLGGGSAVNVAALEPSVKSFILQAPQAFTLSILRPFPTDVRHLLSLAAAVEINILILFFLIFLVWRTRERTINPFLLFCLFFSFSVLMIIGYSVNVVGAIVRYRSIILPFLIVPMAAYIDWKKINDLILGDMKKN